MIWRVSPDGDDKNNGTSTPFRTVEAAQGKVQPGDTISIFGVHPPIIHKGKSGRPGAPITYFGNGQQASIQGTGRFKGCIFVGWSDYIDIDGFVCEKSKPKLRNGEGRGIITFATNYIRIQNSAIRDVSSDGISVGVTNHFQIKNNTVDGSAQYLFGGKSPHGIYAAMSSANGEISGNRIKNPSGCIIQCNGNAAEVPDEATSDRNSLFYREEYGWCEDITIFDNVGVNCGRDGASGSNFDRCRNIDFEDNLYYWHDQGEDDSHAVNCSGIAIYNYSGRRGSYNINIRRSTLWMPKSKGRVGIDAWDGSSATVEQCLVAHDGRGMAIEGDIRVDAFTKIVGTWENGGRRQQGNMTRTDAEALFTDVRSYNFSPRTQVSFGWGANRVTEIEVPTPVLKKIACRTCNGTGFEEILA
jgi:hypothetical protein